MSKLEPAPYRTTNRKSYNDALKRRGPLLVWLDRDMDWLAPNAGKPGRPPVFSDAAIQFCLIIKVLFGLPLRQTTGMVAMACCLFLCRKLARQRSQRVCARHEESLADLADVLQTVRCETGNRPERLAQLFGPLRGQDGVALRRMLVNHGLKAGGRPIRIDCGGRKCLLQRILDEAFDRDQQGIAPH